MQKFSILIASFIIFFGFSQRPKPAPAQKNPIAIINATIHTATGSVLENSSVVFDNGKITQINGSIPQNAKIIDAKNKHVYPGFILANNTMGLIEISATRATVDTREANDITPEVRTLIAFNTDSHTIPVTRTNGILLTQPVMKEGSMACTSSVMNLDGWNWEDAVVKKDVAVHMIWPGNRKFNDEKRDKEFQAFRKNKLTEYKSLFARAKTYEKGGVKDFKLEAIQPVFEDQKLFIEVPGANEALEIIKFIQDNNLKNVVFIGESDLVPVLDDVKKMNIPLIIKRTHSLPPSVSTSPNLPYEFPKIVSDKGILYGLDYSGDKEYQDARNLPFVAGTTVAFGVDKERALQSITLNIAKILGIDKDYGSIEVGKSATLFISDGDALDQLTNNVTEAFIDGRKIDLNNNQKVLYERYKEKYSGN